jgi:preprotein translocase subunit SecG
MQRIIYWMGITACIVLIVSCFLQWTFHSDLGKNFTGFFSEQNQYGKPGKFLTLFAVIILIFMMLPRLWAKRANLFLGALLIAYAIKSYIIYTGCYMANCPEKKTGIFIMLFSSVIVFVCTTMPNMKPLQEIKE